MSHQNLTYSASEMTFLFGKHHRSQHFLNFVEGRKDLVGDVEKKDRTKTETESFEEDSDSAEEPSTAVPQSQNK